MSIGRIFVAGVVAAAVTSSVNGWNNGTVDWRIRQLTGRTSFPLDVVFIPCLIQLRNGTVRAVSHEMCRLSHKFYFTPKQLAPANPLILWARWLFFNYFPMPPCVCHCVFGPWFRTRRHLLARGIFFTMILSDTRSIH